MVGGRHRVASKVTCEAFSVQGHAHRSAHPNVLQRGRSGCPMQRHAEVVRFQKRHMNVVQGALVGRPQPPLLVQQRLHMQGEDH